MGASIAWLAFFQSNERARLDVLDASQSIQYFINRLMYFLATVVVGLPKTETLITIPPLNQLGGHCQPHP